MTYEELQTCVLFGLTKNELRGKEIKNEKHNNKC